MMSTDPVSVMSPSEVVDVYGAAWQEHDDDARRKLLERCWAQNGVYCDPTSVVEGREALVAHIAGFHLRVPGHGFVLSTSVDEHDGWLRFGWLMLGPHDKVVLEGMDFAQLDADGRLRRIVGFFGPLAPAEPPA